MARVKIGDKEVNLPFGKSKSDLISRGAEAVGKITKFGYDPFGVSSDVYHKLTGTPTEKQKREQQNEINAQIKAYKEQTELARQELDTKRNEEATQKRRVEEKQIRQLRRNYRAPGFLGGASTSSEPDMTSNLGG